MTPRGSGQGKEPTRVRDFREAPWCRGGSGAEKGGDPWVARRATRGCMYRQGRFVNPHNGRPKGPHSTSTLYLSPRQDAPAPTERFRFPRGLTKNLPFMPPEVPACPTGASHNRASRATP